MNLIKKDWAPATAIFYSTKETWFVTKTSLNYIFSIFQGKGDASQLGGPIRIAKITGQGLNLVFSFS